MNISLIHTAALGDTILLIPLLRALRAKFPHAHITLVMRPAFGQMFTMRGIAHAWHSADDPAHTAWFSPPDRPHIPNTHPAWANADLLLSAVSTGTDPWADNARAALFPHTDRLLTFNPKPPEDYPRHVTAWHAEQLAAQGLHLPPAPLPPILKNPDGPLVFHPGSGGEAKCWPPDHYLTLADALARNGIKPTFILGEAEQERWGRPAVAMLNERFHTFLHIGLYELSERLARARLYLGNDSGVSHLAAALGTPTITLFGPSNHTQWHPIGPDVTLLHAPNPQQMASLPPETVLHTLLTKIATIELNP